MTHPRSQLRQDYGDAASAAARAPIGLIAILIALAAACGIGALIWWIGVGTSATAGQGNITKDRNSSQNIEHWSATFNGEYQTIQADTAGLAVLKSAANAPGATAFDKTNYTGALLTCNKDVAAYNQDLSNVLAVVPAGDPATPFPATYCESEPTS